MIEEKTFLYQTEEVVYLIILGWGLDRGSQSQLSFKNSAICRLSVQLSVEIEAIGQLSVTTIFKTTRCST